MTTRTIRVESSGGGPIAIQLPDGSWVGAEPDPDIEGEQILELLPIEREDDDYGG